MIYRSNGFPSDHSGDFGDSAMRAGMAELTNMFSTDLSAYESTPGFFVRHPTQEPWNNEKNFTRDQMLPLVAAMSKQGMYSTIRKFFYERAKRLFFMQNTERDEPGSTKYPWPHMIQPYSKSNPNQPLEKRSFDFADPLLPHHVWHIVKAGRIYWAYPIALIGIPLYILELVFHGRSKTKDEENQHITMAYIQGKWAIKLFKLLNKSWENVSLRYWSSRNEVEYHEACKKMIDNW